MYSKAHRLKKILFLQLLKELKLADLKCVWCCLDISEVALVSLSLMLVLLFLTETEAFSTVPFLASLDKFVDVKYLIFKF